MEVEREISDSCGAIRRADEEEEEEGEGTVSREMERLSVSHRGRSPVISQLRQPRYLVAAVVTLEPLV